MSGKDYQDERRGSGRANTRRRAVLRRRGAPHSSFEAWVVDVAPLGLRLVCQVKLQPGDELDVEVHRQDGLGLPLEVRGVVRHVRRAEDQHSVGVQLIVTLGPAVDAEKLLPPQEIRDQLALLRAQLADMNESDTRSMNFDVFSAEGAESPDPKKPKFMARRHLTLALCLVLLGVFLSTWSCSSRLLSDGDGHANWNEQPWWSDLLGKGTAPEQKNSAPEEAPEPVEYVMGEDWQEQGWESLRARALHASAPVLPLSEGKVAGYPGVLLIARLRAAEGDRASALQLLGVLGEMERSDTAPEAWVQHGRQLRELLLSSTGEIDGLPVPLPSLLLPSVVDETTRREASQEPVEETTGGESLPGVVRIEVDTARYTLYAMRDGALLAAFPIGLGDGDKTPRGTFYINNMVKHPDWYDRGRVVPYGDPENILGDHWLGLAGAPEALGIGIHPTEEHETIGGNAGRGCIRMFPLDARQLFEWCEVGAEVVIR